MELVDPKPLPSVVFIFADERQIESLVSAFRPAILSYTAEAQLK